MKITKRVKLLTVALLLVIGLSGGAIGMTHAVTTDNVQANDTETKDDQSKTADNTKDTETNDATKTQSAAATTVQDNSQDGETNDNPNQ